MYAAPAHVTPAHVDECIALGLQCAITWRADELVAVLVVKATRTALCHAFKSHVTFSSESSGNLSKTRYSVFRFCGSHPGSHTRETVGGARYA